MLNLKVLAIGFTSLFFILGLFTLSDYGVNWDATSHLMRGQAYLHYYLTGRNDYLDLDTWNDFRQKDEAVRIKNPQDSVSRHRLYWQNPDTIFFSPDITRDEVPRVSMYQLDKDLSYISEHYDYGHPHISDVLSSVFNFIFYQKLGFLNDIDSYRVYGVFLAACLVGLVFWWTASLYGKFSGIIAALSLALYPLFWAESHFNTEKDIPETVFWSFLLFSAWRGITTSSWKWIIASGVFFGLALGTKFNVLFAIFVILPWLITYLPSKYKREFSPALIIATLVAPFLGIGIIVATWPYFWSDPVGKIGKITDFYRTIGTGGIIDERFLGPLGINTYPTQWIFYTTPLVILFLAGIGTVTMISRLIKGERNHSLLFLLWLFVPIARVTWPGTNIYGGVRQIMEFIPAMAILAGIGAGFLVQKLKVKIQKYNLKFKIFNFRLELLPFAFCLLPFILLLIPIIRLHPNENVYFNPLIAGLKGAAERDFPGWGVSFGAPYRKAIEWVNNNAEPGAKLTLGTEILSNIPGIFIRPDIDYKSNRSGYLRQGEYVISLRFDGTEKRSYFDMYLDKMVEPVYQETVDGVPILKIWKNDEAHLKPEWKNEVTLSDIKYTKKENGLLFDMGKVEKLSRLEIAYRESGCPDMEYAYLQVSKDGESWERVPGVLPEEVRIKTLGTQPRGGKFIEPFAGQKARFINLILSPPDTCLTQVKSAVLYYFK